MRVEEIYLPALLIAGALAACVGAPADSPAEQRAVDEAALVPMDTQGCAVNCLGGACIDGVCQPLQIVDGLVRPWFLEVDGLNVYASSWNLGVVRASLLGGPKTQMVRGATGMAMQGGYIVASVYNEIWRAAPGSASPDPDPVLLATGQNNPVGFITDGTWVYWTNQGDGTLWRIRLRPLNDEVATVFAGGLGHPEAIIRDGQVAYVGDTSSPGHIYRVELASGTVTTTATTASGVWALVLRDSTFYWAEGNGSIQRADLNGTTIVPPLASGEGGTFGIAVDATNVYWTDYAGGRVRRCPRAGGATPISVAENQVRPYSITEDATAVYWVIDRWDTDCSSPPCGGVWKVAKPQ